MKHLLAAAVVAVALGLFVSCGSDDFGLSADTRSKIDEKFENLLSIEQAAVCEQLQSPKQRLEIFEVFLEDLNAQSFKKDVARNEKIAEGEVKYLQAKC